MVARGSGVSGAARLEIAALAGGYVLARAKRRVISRERSCIRAEEALTTLRWSFVGNRGRASRPADENRLCLLLVRRPRPLMALRRSFDRLGTIFDGYPWHFARG